MTVATRAAARTAASARSTRARRSKKAADATDLLTSDVSATLRVANWVRERIARSLLRPGQQVHQEHLAQQLGLSRVPVREALRGLEADGLLSHAPNRGYFVAALSAEELRQVYLMRKMLEAELIKTVVWPNRVQVAELERINRAFAKAGKEQVVGATVDLNRRFHHGIYGLSPLHTVRQEVDRLWAMSEQYRVVYLTDENTLPRVVDEHSKMLDALRHHDNAALLSLMERHRGSSERRMLTLLREPE